MCYSCARFLHSLVKCYSCMIFLWKWRLLSAPLM
jgi:hypothetical protein